MKKTLLTLFIILCLFAYSLKDYKISVKADTEVIHVPIDFSTIQEAINNASSGGIIFVYSKTYYEHLVVNKSVSLIGEDRDSTIIDGNKTGSVIFVTASNVSIRGFTLRNSGISPYDGGIRIEHSSGSIISHNKVIDNYGGISLYFSSDNVVSDNIVSSNLYNGISLYFSTSNVISSNILSSNKISGISLYTSSGNVISGNIISNHNPGILFALSSNNTLYHNNLNNTVQVWSRDSVNVWDYSYEGNYWSKYNGQDLNADGIGDSPYVLDENVRDNYPLMGMFSDFNVYSNEDTYHVTVICNSTISNFRFKTGTETGNKIISFDGTGDDGSVGFCRITIPTELMTSPYIVLTNGDEVTPTLLFISNETVRLCFTYLHNSAITIISREAYNELMDRYLKLQIDFLNLNLTCYDIFNNYSIVLSSYTQLQETYNELMDRYLKLQIDFLNLNLTYHDLLNNYSLVLGNYTQLQESYNGLNSSLQKHLFDYSEQIQNIRSLMYITAAITTIFIITAIYLSKRAHAGIRPKTPVFEDRE